MESGYSTILGRLVQDRHRALGNSRFGFVSARREAKVKLGLGLDSEVELRSVQCFPTRNPRSAGRLRKRRVATQPSAVSAREPWWPEEASSLRRSMGSSFEPYLARGGWLSWRVCLRHHTRQLSSSVAFRAGFFFMTIPGHCVEMNTPMRAECICEAMLRQSFAVTPAAQ